MPRASKPILYQDAPLPLPIPTLTLLRASQTSKEFTNNLPGGRDWTYYRRSIVPQGSESDPKKTLAVYGVHVPPASAGSSFCPVGYPTELRDAIKLAVGNECAAELSENLYDSKLWWKHSEVKQAKAISTHREYHDVELVGYNGKGVMGVGHLNIYLRGKIKPSSMQVIPDSWTLHIDVQIIHVTAFTEEIPRPPVSPYEIATAEFIAELLNSVKITST